MTAPDLDLVATPPQLDVRVVDGDHPYPAGAWIVVAADGRRIECPIPLPVIDANDVWSEVRDRILAMDADHLWDRAVAIAGFGSPAEAMLSVIADAVAPAD